MPTSLRHGAGPRFLGKLAKPAVTATTRRLRLLLGAQATSLILLNVQFTHFRLDAIRAVAKSSDTESSWMGGFSAVCIAHEALGLTLFKNEARPASKEKRFFEMHGL